MTASTRFPGGAFVGLARAPARALALATLAAVLCGCAMRSVNVPPQPASAAQFLGWSCERIDEEAERVQRRAAEVAWAVDERAGNNVIALGVGVAVFWPALLALRAQGPEAEELARLKGRHEALREAATRVGCALPAAELPPRRTASWPVAVGDRLVYEERRQARGPLAEFGFTVLALRREEIEYSPVLPVAASAPRPPLRHDRLGNVVAAAPGALTWPQLLRGELVLGQVMAGELLVAGDTLMRARVRAQVVAVGPQQVSGRRFDAVVLELFGDVLQEPGSTRLDGALVVDRTSGVLLRLDLRSGEAPFRIMRRLVRVER